MLRNVCGTGCRVKCLEMLVASDWSESASNDLDLCGGSRRFLFVDDRG